MSLVDPNSEFGGRVLRRLEQETVIWLTTVGSDGTPQPSPVWFLWDGTSLLIYSKANAPKLRNIARHPQVALSFNSAEDGSNVVILTGTAVLDNEAPLASDVHEYIAKYATHITGIDMDNTSFAEAYRQAIRVTPQKVRGY